MAEAEKGTHLCLRCGITSSDRALITVEFHGDESWICVGCLPFLIHGAME